MSNKLSYGDLNVMLQKQVSELEAQVVALHAYIKQLEEEYKILMEEMLNDRVT